MLLVSASVQAQQRLAAAPDRPKIGLALSGGGARGAAHIGVIRELERLRVPVDYIAGTSMGAIVGGLYATGMNPDDMEKLVNEIDWDDIFRDLPDRENLSLRRKFDDAVFQVDKSFGISGGKLKAPTGFTQGRKLSLLLERLTARTNKLRNFDELPIPFRAVATDIVTGNEVVLQQGNLAAAVRASMSIPGVLAVVEIDGRRLVDGGMANNMPISVVRDMGADIVIAVDISTPLLRQDQLGSAAAIVFQLTGFLTRQNTEAQIATITDQDTLLVPELGDIATSSFKRASEAVAIGEQAAVAAREQLVRYALSAEQYAAHVAHRRILEDSRPVLAFIRIDNDSSVADAVIESRIRLQPGDVLDVAVLDAGLNQVYGMGLFETVRYDVVSEQDETGLVVTVREKPWGPKYLQFGASFSSDFGEEQELGLVIGYTFTPINRLGGEWRSLLRLGEEQGLVTELYQPVAAYSPYFVLPRLFFLNQRFNQIQDGRIIAEDRVERLGGTLLVGREFGTWGRLSAGVTRFTAKVSTRIGPPSEGDTDIDGGEVEARFRVDTLNDFHFPRSGNRSLLGWIGSRESLGADFRFNQLLLDTVLAKSWGRHTLLLGVRYFSTVDGEAPVQSRFRLGGLFELPGFARNELTGQHVALLRSGYLRRLGEAWSSPSYVGFTLQYGNAFEDEDDIEFDNALVAGSAYLGMDTLFGPVYLGYGLAEGGRSSLYLQIGSSFAF
jgi:NTE family protein